MLVLTIDLRESPRGFKTSNAASSSRQIAQQVLLPGRRASPLNPPPRLSAQQFAAFAGSWSMSSFTTTGVWYLAAALTSALLACLLYGRTVWAGQLNTSQKQNSCAGQLNTSQAQTLVQTQEAWQQLARSSQGSGLVIFGKIASWCCAAVAFPNHTTPIHLNHSRH